MQCFLILSVIEINGHAKDANLSMSKKAEGYTAPIFTEGDPGQPE